ncbi:MAG: CAP domain-containing protein [Lachnospiraceae bacterium]|nr:CAP domain-containing protein [Lachnospiraceae bacterium]
MKKMKWAFGLAVVLLLSVSQSCVLQSCAEEQQAILAEESAAVLLEESGMIPEDETDAPDSETEGISDETGQYGQNAVNGGENTIYIEEIESIDESQIPEAVSVDEGDASAAADNDGTSVSADDDGETALSKEESGIIGDPDTAAYTENAGGISLASVSATDTYSLGVTVTYGQTEARSMLDMINSLRTGDDAWYWNESNSAKIVCSGLSELTYDYDLEAIAMQRAAELALFYSHTRPDGTTCWTAYDENSYVWYAVGENIAAGYTTASSVFTGWAEENEYYSGQGHRRNMLSSSFTSVGIGHVYYNGCHYWVQEFARSTNTSTAVSANDSDTDATVRVLGSNISAVVLSADKSACNLLAEESEDLPNLTVSVTLSSTWPGGRRQPVNAEHSWSVTGGSCVSVSGNRLIASSTAGTAVLQAAAMGETLDIPVTVQYDIGKAEASLSENSLTYNGIAQTPTVTVRYGSAMLTENTDYTVSYSNNTNAGTASVTVTGTGSYTGSLSKTFTIAPAAVSGATITLSESSYTWDGSAKTPSVTVNYGGRTLTAGTDYTIAYSNNTTPGTATVTVSGKGNYTGTAQKTFTINKASQLVTASVSASSIAVGGTTTITASGQGTITYSSGNTTVATVSSSGVVTGVAPGIATITVNAAGNGLYNAAGKTITITVKPGTATISTLTNTSKGITVTWNEVTGATGYYIYRKAGSGNYSKIATITDGTTVSYTDTKVKSKNGTKYTYKTVPYTVSAGKTIEGTFTAKTTVRLTGTTLSSVKNSSSKKAVVKWKKSSSVTGYQIQYSTSKTFAKGNKTVKISGASKVSKTLSKLTKKKTYYVRIRTYKTVSGKTYYSAWSSVKKVKITK